MLADRAGVELGEPAAPSVPGLSKVELLGVTAWAEAAFVEALAESPEARSYLEGRGIAAESAARFRLGFAPESRDWLTARARKAGEERRGGGAGDEGAGWTGWAGVPERWRSGVPVVGDVVRYPLSRQVRPLPRQRAPPKSRSAPSESSRRPSHVARPTTRTRGPKEPTGGASISQK